MQSLRTERISPALQLIHGLLSARPYQYYGWAISLCGLLLMLWSLYAIYLANHIINFIILLCLVAVASIPATTSALARMTSFTFSISSVVAIASIPSLGAESGLALAASAHIFLWWFKPKDPQAWKKTWSQLGFNSAMDGLAMAIAGFFYFFAVNFLGAGNILTAGIWLISVGLFVVSNLAILYVMVRLQHGAEVSVSVFVGNIGWSIGLGYLIHGFGGGFLAYAISQYDTQGIFIFFLPIFLSAFAFQLYSKEMQSHMDNLEEIIADRTEELAQLNSEKDAFLAILTHDMNSPLNTIKLTLEMIQRKPTMAVDRPQLIGRTLRAQSMLQQLVSDIVDLGKMEAGKSLELKMTNLNLVKLAKEIVDEQSSRAQAKAIRISLGQSPPELEIFADPYHLQRVLTNLISNAVKYTPNEGQVDVSLLETQEMVEVTIKDTGYGIPEADLPHIFDPYRRVSANSDKAQGTGLGLSITKAIVEAHGGTILVESTEGVGSVFRVKLPKSGQSKELSNARVDA